MRYYVAVLAVAGAAATAAALSELPAGSPPSLRIVGVVAYTQPALVRLRADGLAAGAGVIWRVTPRKGVHRATTVEDILEFAAPAGTYEVDLQEVSLDGKRTKVREVSLTVVISGPGTPVVPPKNPPAAGGPNPSAATCRISFGRSGCTATIVGPQRKDGRWDVLTAAHCVGLGGGSGWLHLPGGGRAALEVIGRYERPDLTWMTVAFPGDPPGYALLCEGPAAIGVKVWHQGYGIDRPGNREEGVVTDLEGADGKLWCRLSVSSGDSGAGIFDAATGRLIGVVSATTAKGRLAPMIAGSCSQAARLRPLPAPVDGLIPLPLPLVAPPASQVDR